mgnify:CR=1 FL=1
MQRNYKLNQKLLAFMVLVNFFLQSCGNSLNQLDYQEKEVQKNEIYSPSTKIRKGLDLALSFQTTLLQRLPSGYELGTAYDNGDCFFDALGQWVDKIKNTDVNTVKYLRSVCHDFYLKNKELVDDWNQREYGGIDKGQEDYYIIQYTAEECERDFNGRAPIWGRPWIEGRILCKELQLKGICFIEVLEDPDTGNPVVSYHMFQEDYKSSISEEEGQALVKEGNIPVLVNVQDKLHFVPLWKKDKSLLESKVLDRASKESKGKETDDNKIELAQSKKPKLRSLRELAFNKSLELLASKSSQELDSIFDKTKSGDGVFNFPSELADELKKAINLQQKVTSEEEYKNADAGRHVSKSESYAYPNGTDLEKTAMSEQTQHSLPPTLQKLKQITQHIETIQKLIFQHQGLNNNNIFLIREELYRISWRVSEIPSSDKFGKSPISKAVPERTWLLLDYLANTLTLLDQTNIEVPILSTLLQGLDKLKSSFFLAIENSNNNTLKKQEDTNEHLESTVGYFFNKKLVKKSLDVIAVVTSSFDNATNEDAFLHNYQNILGLFRVLEILGECSKNITVFTPATSYLITDKEANILRRLRSALEHNQRMALTLAKNVKDFPQKKSQIVRILSGLKFISQKLEYLSSSFEHFETQVDFTTCKNLIQGFKVYLDSQDSKQQTHTENLDNIFQPFVQLTSYLKQTGSLSNAEKDKLLSYVKGNDELEKTLHGIFNKQLDLPDTPESLWALVCNCNNILEINNEEQNKIKLEFYNAHRTLLGKIFIYEEYTKYKQLLEKNREISYKDIKGHLYQALTVDIKEEANKLIHFQARIHLEKLPLICKYRKILELLLKASSCPEEKKNELLKTIDITDLEPYSSYNDTTQYLKYLEKKFVEYQVQYQKEHPTMNRDAFRIIFYSCVIENNKEDKEKFIKNLLDQIFEQLPEKSTRYLVIDFLEFSKEKDPKKLFLDDIKENYNLNTFIPLLKQYKVSLEESKICKIWDELSKGALPKESIKIIKEAIDTTDCEIKMDKVLAEVISQVNGIKKNWKNEILSIIRNLKEPKKVNIQPIKRFLGNYITPKTCKDKSIDEEIKQLLLNPTEEVKTNFIKIILENADKCNLTGEKLNNNLNKLLKNSPVSSTSSTREQHNLPSRIKACPFFDESDRKDCQSLIESSSWNELEILVNNLFNLKKPHKELKKLKKSYSNSSDVQKLEESIRRLPEDWIKEKLKTQRELSKGSWKEEKSKSLLKKLQKYSPHSKLKNRLINLLYCAFFDINNFNEDEIELKLNKLDLKKFSGKLKDYKKNEIKALAKDIANKFFAKSNTGSSGYDYIRLLQNLSFKIKELSLIFESLLHEPDNKVLNFAAEYLIEDIGQNEADLLFKNKNFPNYKNTFISKRYFFLLNTYRKVLAHHPIEIDEELLQYNIEQLVLDTNYRLKQLNQAVENNLQQLENISFQASRNISFDELDEKKNDIYMYVESLGFKSDFKLFSNSLWCDLGIQGDLNLIVESRPNNGRIPEFKKQVALIELEITLSKELNCNVKVYDSESLETRFGTKISSAHFKKLLELIRNGYTLEDVLRGNVFMQAYREDSWSSVTLENGLTIYKSRYRNRQIYEQIIKFIGGESTANDRNLLSNLLSNTKQLKKSILVKFTEYNNNPKNYKQQFIDFLGNCDIGCKPIKDMELVYIPLARATINNLEYYPLKLFYEPASKLYRGIGSMDTRHIKISVEQYDKLSETKKGLYRKYGPGETEYQRYDTFFQEAQAIVKEGQQLNQFILNLLVQEIINFCTLYTKEILYTLSEIPSLGKEKFFRAAEIEYTYADKTLKSEAEKTELYIKKRLEQDLLLKSIINQKAVQYIDSLIDCIKNLLASEVIKKSHLDLINLEKCAGEILYSFYQKNQRKLTFFSHAIDSDQKQLLKEAGIPSLAQINCIDQNSKGEDIKTTKAVITPIYINSWYSFYNAFLVNNDYREYVIAQAEEKDKEDLRKVCDFLEQVPSLPILGNLRIMFMPIRNSLTITKLIELISTPINQMTCKEQITKLIVDDFFKNFYNSELENITLSTAKDCFNFIPLSQEVVNEYSLIKLKQLKTIYSKYGYLQQLSPEKICLENIAHDEKILTFEHTEVERICQQVSNKKTNRIPGVYISNYSNIENLPRICTSNLENILNISPGGWKKYARKFNEKTRDLEDLIISGNWNSQEEIKKFILQYKNDGGYDRDNILIKDYFEHRKYCLELKAYKHQEDYYKEKLNSLNDKLADPTIKPIIQNKLTSEKASFKQSIKNNVALQECLLIRIKRSNFFKGRVEERLRNDPDILQKIVNIIDPIKEKLMSDDIDRLANIFRKQIALKAELEMLEGMEFNDEKNELGLRYDEIREELESIESAKDDYRPF